MATVVQTDFGPVDIDAGEAAAVSYSVAVFNPAIKGTDEGGNPIVILVIRSDGDLVVIDANGKLRISSMREVTTDWRYDIGKEQWVDTSGISLEGDTQ